MPHLALASTKMDRWHNGRLTQRKHIYNFTLFKWIKAQCWFLWILKLIPYSQHTEHENRVTRCRLTQVTNTNKDTSLKWFKEDRPLSQVVYDQSSGLSTLTIQQVLKLLKCDVFIMYNIIFWNFHHLRFCRLQRKMQVPTELWCQTNEARTSAP